MSSIHEALKKAQREKDAGYQKYRGIVSAPRYNPVFFSGKKLWWASFLVISLAFTAYLWLPSRGIRSPIPEPVELEATPKPESLPLSSPLSDGNREGRKGEPSKTLPFSKGGLGGDFTRHSNHESTLNSTATSLYEKARDFQKSGRLQEAKRLYEEALDLDPEYVDALNNLGVIYIQDKKYSAARALFLKAIQLRPNYVDSHYNLACLHAIKGNVRQSLDHLNRAVSLDPEVKNWARTDSDLQNLRGVAGFEKMVGRNRGME
ncbi:MAG: tetratricopeptide repeat protein [Desulfobacterales bacterium]|nr:tetratricopeptide repeat protein [Desulfobacterales bacterium]